MILVLRTYGGLGNQLFQHFFCQNLQQKIKFKKIYSIHDLNYPHQFEQNSLLEVYSRPSKIIKLISDLRLPMILSRLGIWKKGYIKIGNLIILDSYFQEKSLYSSFTKMEIKKSLESIKKTLGILQTDTKFKNVYHIRLKDFFYSEKDEIHFLKFCLDKMEPNSHIITNRQDLFSSKGIKERVKKINLSLIDTSGYDALDVIKEFSLYSNIITNNSTLAIWAAILHDRNLVLPNPEEYSDVKTAFDQEFEYSKLIEFLSIF